MHDDTFRYSPQRHRDAVYRLRDWLSRRPVESWLFFVAGIVLGSVVG